MTTKLPRDVLPHFGNEVWSCMPRWCSISPAASFSVILCWRLLRFGLYLHPFFLQVIRFPYGFHLHLWQDFFPWPFRYLQLPWGPSSQIKVSDVSGVPEQQAGGVLCLLYLNNPLHEPAGNSSSVVIADNTTRQWHECFKGEVTCTYVW